MAARTRIPGQVRKRSRFSFFESVHSGQFMANALPTGCYEYCVGTHSGSVTVRGVLRLGNGPTSEDAGPATVLRTQNDGIYGTQDYWDPTKPMDNIHPGHSLSYPSSSGCLTVRGRPHTDEWEMFRDESVFGHLDFLARCFCLDTSWTLFRLGFVASCCVVLSSAPT